MLDQQYVTKLPKTLAEEVVKRMLDGVANNEISAILLKLYYKWADSAICRPSLETYIRNYKLYGTANPWNAHPDHCFEKLDEIALKRITENFRDESFVEDKLQKLKKIIFSSKAHVFVPAWWQDVWLLFQANMSGLSNCNNLNACI